MVEEEFVAVEATPLPVITEGKRRSILKLFMRVLTTEVPTLAHVRRLLDGTHIMLEFLLLSMGAVWRPDGLVRVPERNGRGGDEEEEEEEDEEDEDDVIVEDVMVTRRDCEIAIVAYERYQYMEEMVR